MNCAPCTPFPNLPEQLAALAELALDLRWSWSHATDILWQRIAPELWALTRNPWLVLQNASRERLQALTADRDFLASLQNLVDAHQEILTRPAWFQTAYLQPALVHVAYFTTSVAGVSTQWASDAGTRAPDGLHRVAYASANLIHRLLPTLLVGAEMLWGRATRVDGVTATNARLQLSVRYLVR